MGKVLSLYHQNGRLRTSPFGHERKLLAKRFSARESFRGHFKSRPFVASFPFLKRTLRNEREFDWDVLDFPDRPTDMSKTFPFSFENAEKYHKILDAIELLYKEMSKEATELIGCDWEVVSDNENILSNHIDKPEDLTGLNVVVSELDILKKFTIQYPIWGAFYADPPIGKNPAITEEMKSVFRAFIKGAKARMKSKGMSKGVLTLDDISLPIDTVPGTGVFQGEDDTKPGYFRTILLRAVGKLCSNIERIEPSIRCEEPSSVELPISIFRGFEKVAKMLKLWVSIILGSASACRTGPNRKAVNELEYEQDDITAAKSTTNLAKLRNVFMSSYLYNIILLVFEAICKTIRKVTFGMFHTPMTESEYKSSYLEKGYRFPIELDISGFDRDMPASGRSFIFETICDEFDLPESMKTLLNNTFYMSYLTPSFGSREATDGLEHIPLTPNILMSGLIITTSIGSLVAFWAALYSIYKAKIVTLKDIENGTWYRVLLLLNQGDDVLMLFRNKMDILQVLKIVKDAFAEFGLKLRFGPGCRMLMRMYIAGSQEVNYPNGARVLQQTVSNESPPANVDVAIIGMLSRSMGWPNLKRACGSKCGRYSALLVKYYSSLEDIMNMTPLLITLNKSKWVVKGNFWDLEDDGKRAIISKISLDMDQTSTSLVEWWKDTRLSRTGQELMKIFEQKINLMKKIKEIQSRESKFTAFAIESMGLTSIMRKLVSKI